MILLLCEGCRRHVRGTELKCPFCGAPSLAGPAAPSARRSALALVGLLVAATAGAAGCARERAALYAGPPVEPDRDRRMVQWQVTLDDDAPTLLSDFEARAKESGCETSRDGEATLATCPDGAVLVRREGRTVTIACDRGDLEHCRALFRRIAAATTPTGAASASTTPKDAGSE